MEKLAKSCILSPNVRAVLDQGGVAANLPKFDQF
jgi:hypothetical protein